MNFHKLIIARLKNRFRIIFKNCRSLRRFARARVVLFVHDAHRHGAQLLSLQLLRELGIKFGAGNVVAVVLGRGALLDAFQDLNGFYALPNSTLVFKVLSLLLPRDAILIFNSLVTQQASPMFLGWRRKSIALVHELPSLIRDYKLEEITKNVPNCDHIVFASDYVRDHYCAAYPIPNSEKVKIVPQGIYQIPKRGIDPQRNLKVQLGIPSEAFLVVNLAYGDFRKAPDVFIAVALNYAQTFPADQVHFVWVGGIDQRLRLWLEQDLAKSKSSSKIKIVDFRDDVENIYASLDCLFLTSREDPFPSTVLEAFYHDKPILLFDDGNGFIGMKDSQFIFTEYQNSNKAVQAIRRLSFEKPAFKHDEHRFYLTDIYLNKLMELTAHEL